MCKCSNQADMNDALSADLAEAQTKINDAREWVDVLVDTISRQDTALRAILEAVNQTDIARLVSSQAIFKSKLQQRGGYDVDSTN